MPKQPKQQPNIHTIDANLIHATHWNKIANPSDDLYTEINEYYNNLGTFYEFLQDIDEKDKWPNDLFSIIVSEHMWLPTIMAKWASVKEVYYIYCVSIAGGVFNASTS